MLDVDLGIVDYSAERKYFRLEPLDKQAVGAADEFVAIFQFIPSTASSPNQLSLSELQLLPHI